MLRIFGQSLNDLYGSADITFRDDVTTFFLKNRSRHAVLIIPKKNYWPAHRQDSGKFAGNDKSLNFFIQRNQVNIPGGQSLPKSFPEADKAAAKYS